MTILRRLWNLLRPAPPICWRCGEPMLDKYRCDECGVVQIARPGVLIEWAPPPIPDRLVTLPPGFAYHAADRPAPPPAPPPRRPPRPDTPEPR